MPSVHYMLTTLPNITSPVQDFLPGVFCVADCLWSCTHTQSKIGWGHVLGCVFSVEDFLWSCTHTLQNIG